MAPNIGKSYALSIGYSDALFGQSQIMGKVRQEKIWDRLIEALTDAGKLPPGKPRGAQPILADLLGVSQPTVSDWKSGKMMPTIDRCRDIAIEFGVCVEWIYTGRGPKRPVDVNNPLPAELMETWAQLSDSNRLRVVERAQSLLEDQFPGNADMRHLQRN